MKKAGILTLIGAFLLTAARVEAGHEHAKSCDARGRCGCVSAREREQRKERQALANAQRRMLDLREQHADVERCIRDVRAELATLERQRVVTGAELAEYEAKLRRLRRSMVNLERTRASIERELAKCGVPGRRFQFSLRSPGHGDPGVVGVIADVISVAARFGDHGRRDDRHERRLRRELRRVNAEISNTSDELCRVEQEMERTRKRHERVLCRIAESQTAFQAHGARLASIDRKIGLCRAEIARHQERLVALAGEIAGCHKRRHTPGPRVARRFGSWRATNVGLPARRVARPVGRKQALRLATCLRERPTRPRWTGRDGVGAPHAPWSRSHRR